MFFKDLVIFFQKIGKNFFKELTECFSLFLFLVKVPLSGTFLWKKLERPFGMMEIDPEPSLWFWTWIKFSFWVLLQLPSMLISSLSLLFSFNFEFEFEFEFGLKTDFKLPTRFIFTMSFNFFSFDFDLKSSLHRGKRQIWKKVYTSVGDRNLSSAQNWNSNFFCLKNFALLCSQMKENQKKNKYTKRKYTQLSFSIQNEKKITSKYTCLRTLHQFTR